ncbi:MAG TPA: cell wall hydrolase [Allosphingosinicella sp.]|nr:cell wall hydrolase [Allosphingosinicella sp.]
MNRIVRACGVAAAALGCLAAYAVPSEANGTDAAPATHFLAHAAATIDGADFGAETFRAEAADTEQMIVKAAGSFLKVAEAAVPRPRTLDELVTAYAGTDLADGEQECLANAVYFEARSEPIEGQLAVAEVVLNRAASGRYPQGICEVVVQPRQFSFIEQGRFPAADRTSKAWRKAVAIAQIAQDKLAGRLPQDVLWYHADYVAPVWRKQLTKEAKIGLHIFYS